ncbi:uncharacterized protein LOC136078580 [Hydra vulgaris]|uniref:Uncharacterized protein LOC136078580 n=1 Tax=Hydra vulgaris TaxID=6087 RepID=A0ABM4BMX6_HYDVU
MTEVKEVNDKRLDGRPRIHPAKEANEKKTIKPRIYREKQEEKKEIDPKYERLRTIKKKPVTVKLPNMKKNKNVRECDITMELSNDYLPFSNRTVKIEKDENENEKKISCFIKMENKNVTESKQIAKERKIKYYNRMRKSDLIRALQSTSVEQRNILDEHIPDSNQTSLWIDLQHRHRQFCMLQDQVGFVSVENMDINTIEYNPIKAKSYIPLDINLATKNAINNIKNEDNLKDNHPERVDKELKNKAEKMNWDKIEIPVSLNQITQFEKIVMRRQYRYQCQWFDSEESLSKHILYCETHVYADFESFIKPIYACEPNPDDFYTKQHQRHIPSSFCYYIKCFDESFYQSSPVTFTASSETDGVAQIFVDSLEEDIIKIYNKIKFPKGMIFTDENNDDFNAACHNSLFHSLSGYDSHLFIKKLSGGKLSCIPNNKEKYISLSRKIKVGELINKEGKKVEVKRELRFLDNLLLKKDVYPYDWVDSINRFNETQLPPKESFFSRLNSERINVLLLADVFENFRDLCINNYGLDPAWYYTAPGLAWNAALNKTEIKLELLSDYDMILKIKKGIRDGNSMTSNRLGTSNNKYIGDAYDQSKPSTYVQYLDANILHGWAVSKPLPTLGFK